MGKIWEFFEHLDEYVYVSDPETNQLVYMNQKALKSYGFQSKEEIVGLKCYEVLQGIPLPAVSAIMSSSDPAILRNGNITIR